MIKKALTTFVVLLVLVNISCQERYPDLEDGLYAEIVTTKDTMVTKLFFEKVPVTVANFVALAEGKHPLVKDEYKGKPFYEGITFHRVMNNFMIQAGDPTGTGSGDSGYKFEDEFREDLKHDKAGVLSMANIGPLATNGTQFFITEKPTPWLDAYGPDGNLRDCNQPRVGCHTVFGQLVKGMEVRDAISDVKVGAGSKPVEDVVITKVNIIRKGGMAKKFDAVTVFNEGLPKLKEQAAEALAEKARKAEEAKKEANAKVETAKAEFLKKNAELKGRKIESPTGMVMIFTKEANGIKPKPTDQVNIDCAGYFESGELFWTTWKDVAQKNGKYEERQDKGGGYKAFTMPYSEKATLVAGFREAMLNMKIGDEARVFIPHYLGYGERGNPPVIPPNVNLVFDVRLTSIKK